jgi:hypothetical protein|nr:MAG TPA: hypothetical protein [Caudoviricetes sp.]
MVRLKLKGFKPFNKPLKPIKRLVKEFKFKGKR